MAGRCSGERGEYALLAGHPRFARTLLSAVARSAHDRSDFMPEQVWDRRAPYGTARRFSPGERTMSAMPLAWTHAQFLRLAAGIAARAPVGTPQVVACRCAREACDRSGAG